MRLSRNSEYALQAVLFLAAQQDREYRLLREISGALDIPLHSLGKTLQQLTRVGVLESYKGKRGGYRLTGNVGDLCLADVIQVVERADYLHACILGFSQCGAHRPCVLHPAWAEARRVLDREFRGKSVLRLGRDMARRLQWEVPGVTSGRLRKATAGGKSEAETGRSAPDC